MRVRWAPWIILAFLAPAAAQGLDVAPVEEVFLHGGDAATIRVEIVSRSPDAQHLELGIQQDVRSNWNVTVEPEQWTLQSGARVSVDIHISAADRPAPRHLEGLLVITAITPDFESERTDVPLLLHATGTDLILGRWENPLPEPLDEELGSFVLNVAAWLLISQLTVWVILPVLRRIADKTPVEEDQALVGIITRPVFILMFTFGVKQSVEVFPLPAWLFSTLDRTWSVVLALVIVYVVYRLWREVILGVGKRVAKRTESELDDVLYPVFEKLGSVLIFVIGLWIVVSSFGVDMALFAAGGAVVSLVIAFAAQDTLGNFFSGIFILLDRPFRVGDRIELPEQNHWGDVTKIGLRTTAVRTQDNRMVIFPNSYIGSNPIINHSYPEPTYRIQIDFKLPYGTDVEFVRKTLVEAVKPVKGVHPERAPEALLLEFTEHGQGWRLRWWIDSYTDTRRAYDRVNSAVIKEMSNHNIRVQYMPLTIWDAHQLLDRESGGGLSPAPLDEAEQAALAEEAEANRANAEAQETAELDAMRRKARKSREEE